MFMAEEDCRTSSGILAGFVPYNDVTFQLRRLSHCIHMWRDSMIHRFGIMYAVVTLATLHHKVEIQPATFYIPLREVVGAVLGFNE